MEKDIIISLWYGLAFMVNPKLKNKIYRPGKSADRIPILPKTKRKQKRVMNQERWF